MATAVKQTETFLAYDGDCPMCTSLIGLLLRSKLVRPEQARSNLELEGEDLEQVRAAGIRNQLIVLDPATRETRAGADGLLWIIGDNLGRPWWIRLLCLPGMRQLTRFAYEAVSYNRRIISPPRHQIVCDCEPEVTVVRRLMLIVPCLLLATLNLGLLSMAVLHGAGWQTALSGAGAMLLAASAGCGVLVLAAIAQLRGEKRIDFIGHLSVTLLAGSLVCLPAAALAVWLPPTAALAVGALALTFDFVLILRVLPRRRAALGLSTTWLTGWGIALGIGWVATIATLWAFVPR